MKSIAPSLKPRLLLLTLSIATALTACNKDAPAPEAAAPAPKSA